MLNFATKEEKPALKIKDQQMCQNEETTQTIKQKTKTNCRRHVNTPPRSPPHLFHPPPTHTQLRGVGPVHMPEHQAAG